MAINQVILGYCRYPIFRQSQIEESTSGLLSWIFRSLEQRFTCHTVILELANKTWNKLIATWTFRPTGLGKFHLVTNVAINPFTPKHWPCSFWEVDLFCWHFEGMGLVDIVCTPKQSKQSTYRTEDLELCAGFAGLHDSFLALWSRGPALKHGDGRFHECCNLGSIVIFQDMMSWNFGRESF